MPSELDPYRDWLGIKDPQRPVDLYGLLDLKQFEHDEFRIGTHAMMQINAVIRHEGGPHADLAKGLLNELQAAQDVLCDPRRKQFYDEQLRRQSEFSLSSATAYNREPAGRNAEEFAASLLADADPVENANGKPAGHVVDRPADLLALSNEATNESDLGAKGPILDDDDDDDDSLGKALSQRLGRKPRRAAPLPSKDKPSKKKDSGKPKARVAEEMKASTKVTIALVVIAIAGFAIGVQFMEFGRTPDPVPSLLTQISNPDSDARFFAVRALKNLDVGPEAMQLLLKILREDRVEAIRVAAAEAIVFAPSDTSPYLDDLSLILATEQNNDVRSLLKHALSKHGRS